MRPNDCLVTNLFGIERSMAHSHLKQVHLALLLLVFLSQWTLASTMHCVSSVSDLHAGHAMAQESHHVHHAHYEELMEMPTAMDPLSVETVADCCGTVDHCLSGGCLLPPVAHDVSKWDSPVPLPIIASLYEITAPSRPISSLYRPPIVR